MFFKPDHAERIEWKVAYVANVKMYTVHFDVIDLAVIINHRTEQMLRIIY